MSILLLAEIEQQGSDIPLAVRHLRHRVTRLGEKLDHREAKDPHQDQCQAHQRGIAVAATDDGKQGQHQRAAENGPGDHHQHVTQQPQAPVSGTHPWLKVTDHRLDPTSHTVPSVTLFQILEQRKPHLILLLAPLFLMKLLFDLFRSDLIVNLGLLATGRTGNTAA